MEPKTKLILIARIMMALPFLVSGMLKLSDPGRFLLDMQAFPFLPYPLAYFTAATLPWLEVICALCLFTAKLLQGALTILSAMTLGFIAFIAYATHLGYSADCGCFGEWLVFPSVTAHLLFNAGLLIGLLGLMAMYQKTPTATACVHDT